MKHLTKMADEHNETHPNNGILTVSKNIGGTYNIGLGLVPILSGLTDKEAFYVLAAINNYADAQKGES